MSGRLQLQVRAGPRDLSRLPLDEDALGEAMFAEAAARLPQGPPPPVGVALSGHGVQQIDLRPIIALGDGAPMRFLASMAGQPDVDCLAQLAVLQQRRAGRPVERGLCLFIEWTDCRWWMRWLPLDAQRAPSWSSVRTLRAREGWPRPSGLGGWFSLARRAELCLRLDAPGEQPGLHLVH